MITKATSTVIDTTELGSNIISDPSNAITTEIASKLDTTSYTANDVLTKVKTVDGAGSGLDADTIDGIQGADIYHTGNPPPSSASSNGEVGTYAFLSKSAVHTGIALGETIAGSSLRYTGVVNHTSAYGALGGGFSGSPSGTWKAVGYCDARYNFYPSTMFVRIA